MTKLELKAKARNAWNKTKEEASKIYLWCMDNKGAVAVVAPIVISSGVELIKVCVRKGNTNEQKRLKELYIYDRSSGHYFELRRKMKNSELIEFDERKKRGESVGNILRDMRVLK